MKVAILTANGIRHKYLANTLSKHADEALVVTECEPQDTAGEGKDGSVSTPIEEHFALRHKTEEEFFKGNDTFYLQSLPVQKGELNLPFVYKVLRNFGPDLIFVFGSSIIKEPLLSLLSPGRMINLHLGLSPYYRGSGTNFWPFVNDELEYVGATIHYIDAGVDSGDIIAHVRPEFAKGDTAHTVGCKVVRKGVEALTRIFGIIKEGRDLPRVSQWSVPNERYYKKADFNEEVLRKYYDNLKNGMIERYIKEESQKNLRLISL